MKTIRNIMGSLLLIVGLVSCDDWLEVNNDPNTATQSEASVASRLP